MPYNSTAQSIMQEFADATGLSNNARVPRRYLWTDAFAVCNYLGFFRQTGDKFFLQQAIKLVDQVHATLGKHRNDSGHSGWISGLAEEQARSHPAIGGLRIGKNRNERKADEPSDEALEWQQDGQYFHYLTKWMQALNYVSLVTGDAIYNQWAMELARAAHSAFVYLPPSGGTKRMYWKMSIDLSRPLVHSMGQHDPLDGLITFQQLEATAIHFSRDPAKAPPSLSLKAEIDDFFSISTEKQWATYDELGIGAMLSDAYRLAQLIADGYKRNLAVFIGLLQDIETSLQIFATNNRLAHPPEYRLAFRELGLAIGLQAISKIQRCIERHPEIFKTTDSLSALLIHLSEFSPIHKVIESFWLDPAHRASKSWRDHSDINNVMLVTSLVPEGYLHE